MMIFPIIMGVPPVLIHFIDGFMMGFYQLSWVYDDFPNNHGGTPSSHPFYRWIFQQINHPAIGVTSIYLGKMGPFIGNP